MRGRFRWSAGQVSGALPQKRGSISSSPPWWQAARPPGVEVPGGHWAWLLSVMRDGERIPGTNKAAWRMCCEFFILYGFSKFHIKIDSCHDFV